jgi:hypothetical protein
LGWCCLEKLDLLVAAGDAVRYLYIHGMILVGKMGTVYVNKTDKPLADLNQDDHKIKNLTHKLNEHSIRHIHIKTRYALQYNLNNILVVI